MEAAPESSSPRPVVQWQAAEDGSLGVFAGKAFAAGELVERCYCLSWDWHHPCSLRPWLYDQGPNANFMFPLGWGLLYNSPIGASEPNLQWEPETKVDGKRQVRHYIKLTAVRAIVPGEELCVHRQLKGAVVRRRDLVGTRLAHLEKDPVVIAALKKCSELAEFSSEEAVLVGGSLRSPDNDAIQMRLSPVDGNGVYAARPFKAGEIVEICPVLPIRKEELGKCLDEYYFKSFVPTMALGLGGVYNHHDRPNLIKTQCKTSGCPRGQRLCINFVANRDINAGEELFHSYGSDWWEARTGTPPGAKVMQGAACVGMAGFFLCSVQ